MTVEAVFRREYGRCVATLIRFLGDIDAAEEAVQDAFTVAVAKWPSEGQPPNPLHLPTGCAFHPRCPFAIGKCRSEIPALTRAGNDHLVACWVDVRG